MKVCYVTTIKLTLNELVMASALNQMLKPNIIFARQPENNNQARPCMSFTDLFT